MFELTADKNNAYSFMCQEILPCSVGKFFWEGECHKMKMSKIAKALDEGFCMIVLSNYWDRWWALVDGADKDAAKKVATKYTDGGSGATATMHNGWTPAGQSEFGRLVKMVKTERKSNNPVIKSSRKAFEKKLMKFYEGLKGTKVSKKKKKRPEVQKFAYEDDMNEFGNNSGGEQTSDSEDEDEGETGRVSDHFGQDSGGAEVAANPFGRTSIAVQNNTLPSFSALVAGHTRIEVGVRCC